MPRRLSPLLTLGPIGYLPAPGTAGSVAGAALFLALRELLPAEPLLRCVVGFLAVLAVCALCLALLRGRVDIARDDPPAVVLDEVAGVWLALLPLMLAAGHRPGAVVVGFLLFRILDATKPACIGALDRRGTALALLGDDLVAGAFAAVGTLLMLLPVL